MEQLINIREERRRGAAYIFIQCIHMIVTDKRINRFFKIIINISLNLGSRSPLVGGHLSAG